MDVVSGSIQFQRVFEGLIYVLMLECACLYIAGDDAIVGYCRISNRGGMSNRGAVRDATLTIQLLPLSNHLPCFQDEDNCCAFVICDFACTH